MGVSGGQEGDGEGGKAMVNGWRGQVMREMPDDKDESRRGGRMDEVSRRLAGGGGVVKEERERRGESGGRSLAIDKGERREL
jgi:hypothetical protein